MVNEVDSISIEEFHKEIDLIQACISRMSSNSFCLKGWLVSILAIIIVIAPENSNKYIVLLISLLIIIAFWSLDSFFLRTEKMYRKMYEWVLHRRKENEREMQYDLNPQRFESAVDSPIKVMFSVTLRWFYGCVAIADVLIALYYILN
ncbi:MAG TPA: hypothetical protein PLF24_01215 [Ruminococcus sp.]|nr:hypothetical protein [Ruminococcus sp.]